MKQKARLRKYTKQKKQRKQRKQRTFKKQRKQRKFSHKPLTRVQIEAIERQYWERYNAGIHQWQADMY